MEAALAHNAFKATEWRDMLKIKGMVWPIFGPVFHPKFIYMVWHESTETDFFLTMNFILFTNQGYPLQNSPLGSYTVTEALFPLFVAVLEGFCWYTFQLVGYALLDIIQNFYRSIFVTHLTKTTSLQMLSTIT